jgi:hypothetical protein
MKCKVQREIFERYKGHPVRYRPIIDKLGVEDDDDYAQALWDLKKEHKIWKNVARELGVGVSLLRNFRRRIGVIDKKPGREVIRRGDWKQRWIMDHGPLPED